MLPATLGSPIDPRTVGFYDATASLSQEYQIFLKNFSERFNNKEYGEAENLLQNSQRFHGIFARSKPFDCMMDSFLEQEQHNNIRLLNVMLSKQGLATEITISLAIAVYCNYENFGPADELHKAFKDKFPEATVSEVIREALQHASHPTTHAFYKKVSDIFAKRYDKSSE